MASLKLSSLLSNLVVKETATLNWTIDTFYRVNEARSAYFSPKNNEKTKFRLKLNATNHLFTENCVFLEFSYNRHEKDVLLCYRISMLDANGVKHCTKEYLWNQKNELYNYNVTSYISRDKCNELLVNENLRIFCEVDILGENTNQLQLKQIESCGKLVEDFETFLGGGKLTDFTVQIGDKAFRVHKAILAARSAVFGAMFEHGETKEGKEARVVIVDVSADVFELLIRYIYTGKVDNLSECAAELLVAADKYQLDHLKSICEQSLISTIATESVCAVLLISDMHSAHQLKSKCIEYIVDNWKEVKETKCWKEGIKDKRADLIEQILDFRY